METNDFVVKSMSHCFLCLEPISPEEETSPSFINSKCHQSDIQSFSIYSLQNLSRYLKMDLAKVFNDNELIPQHLLDKVRKSKLKGELCDKCALLNDMFSEQYLKLVKIKMEMTSSLRVIQEKLLTAMGTNKSVELRKLANSLNDPVDGWMGKLDILEILRSEAIQKCTQKISGDTPRPKVQNLTMPQVNKEKQKFTVNSIIQNGFLDSNFEESPDSNMECKNLKAEFTGQKYVDNDNSYDSGNSDMHGPDGYNYTVEEGGIDISPLTAECRTIGTLEEPNLRVKRMRKSDANDKYSPALDIPSGSDKSQNPEVTLNPKTGRYKCTLCPREFKRKDHLKTHHKSVHLGVKYKCSICGIEFTYRCAFNLHHRTIHMGVRLKCLGCNKLFTRKQHLIVHQKTFGCKRPVTNTEIT